jgi:hypothetical protein
MNLFSSDRLMFLVCFSVQRSWILDDEVDRRSWISDDEVDRRSWILDDEVDMRSWILDDEVDRRSWILGDEVDMGSWILSDEVKIHSSLYFFLQVNFIRIFLYLLYSKVWAWVFLDEVNFPTFGLNRSQKSDMVLVPWVFEQCSFCRFRLFISCKYEQVCYWVSTTNMS